MGAVLLVLLLALVLGGLGFAVHVLWWIALIVLAIWLIGFFVRGAEGARWYRWYPPARPLIRRRMMCCHPASFRARVVQEGPTMATTGKAATTWNGGLADGNGKVSLQSSGIGTYDVSWAARSEEPNGKTSPEELIAA